MTPSLEDRPARPRWRWMPLLRLFAVLLLVLAVLALSGAPSVAPPQPPSATNIDLARGVVKQVVGQGYAAGTRLPITVSQAELDGLSALANQVLAPVRVEARLEPSSSPDPAAAARSPRAAPPPAELVARASRALPLGAWLNVEARAISAVGGKGLPVVRAKIGRVPIPAWLTRFVMRRAWLAFQGDAEEPKSLDETIPYVRIDAQRALAVVIHPGRGVAYGSLARFGGKDPDPFQVASAYCVLARHADADLATVVRRAWRLPQPAHLSPADQNRALMIAVAMRSVPEYRDRLAGNALPLIGRCINPPAPITLAGRNDLAKHWALSAALSASLGGTIAQSLGVWKELSDSLKGGTGFSFVDIAADRSGERFANAATDPQLARFVQTRLAAVTEPQLLAPEVLAKPEGLDAKMFEQIYDNVDSPEYRSAIAAIDALLDDVGVPKP